MTNDSNDRFATHKQQTGGNRFDDGIDRLVATDQDLAMVIEQWGKPKQMKRSPGFTTLLRIILGQQVSLSAATSIFNRLNEYIPEINPTNFLDLEVEQLKAIGFSRQKTTYCRALAEAITSKELELDSLDFLSDEAIRTQLTKIKGIGDWTADMYLMTALQRLDIFPSKDLAVAVATQEIKQLKSRPTQAELEMIAQRWRPYRAVAAMILWHHYLNRSK